MTLRKFTLTILLTFTLTIAYQVFAAYLTSPEGLQYPNPGHYPGEIGPGTFNCSNNTNCFWKFPNALFINSTSGKVGIGTENPKESLEVNGSAKIHKDLKVEGGIVVGNPAGGNKGPGTINAQKIYVNGSEISGIEGLNRSEILDMLYFGSGKDGDVVITSNTTLTRDMEYRNLTIKSGATLNPNGWRIFVLNTLIIEKGASISRDGNDGEDAHNCPGWGAAQRCRGNGGAPLFAHTVGGSGGGGSGGQGGGGGSGESGEAGGDGGDGGDISGASGGRGGTGGNKIIDYLPSPFLPFLSINPEIAKTGGAGGGGGAASSSGSGVSAGGGGGSGGGIIHIFAKHVVLNGNITARGGDGGNGACACYTIGHYGCWIPAGGGGGGGGGFVLLVYKTKTGSGTIDVSGGQGGKGCTADNGDVGKDGADGKPGHVKEIQLIY